MSVERNGDCLALGGSSAYRVVSALQTRDVDVNA